MDRNWLEMVFPAALGLLVITIGVFVLSMTGLLNEAPAAGPELISTSDTTSNPPATPPPPSPEMAVIAAGDALFRGNCAQCHAIDDVVVGPALSGIGRRRPVSWLIPWVKNSGKMVASGDEYAVKIYNQYQQQQMPSFQLSDEEIRQILAYIQSQEGQGRAVAAQVGARP